MQIDPAPQSACPFCGETQALTATGPLDGKYAVHCYICGTEGPLGDDQPKALEGWNTRMPPVCQTCDGTGAVGHAPDDYSSCPECNSLVDDITGEREAIVAFLRQGGDRVNGVWYSWDSEMLGYAKSFAERIEREDHRTCR